MVWDARAAASDVGAFWGSSAEPAGAGQGE